MALFDLCGHEDNLLPAKLCLDNVAKYRPPYLANGLTLGFRDSLED